MDQDELERATGKIFWALLPSTVAILVGMKVLVWIVKTFVDWQYWNTYDRLMYKATMSAVDSVMKEVRRKK